MYRVVHFFTDLQDDRHPYNVGDIFPREGKTVSEERIAELSGAENRQGVPLIRKEEPENTTGLTRTAVNRMSASDLRRLALEEGISGADEMVGTELRRILIDHFRL